jgi:hypothetical protein
VSHTTKTPGGITYTALKPVVGQPAPPALRNRKGSLVDKQQRQEKVGGKTITVKGKLPASVRRQHPLKGKFGLLTKHFGGGEARPGQQLRTWISEARSWYGGKTGTRGATLFVHRYQDQQSGKPKATVVDEHNWIGWTNRYAPPVRVEFKNQGRAATYMKNRYGLSIPTREYIG